MNIDTNTVELLKIIGSPFVPRNADVYLYESEELFYFAHKNRVGLLYLQTLKDHGKLYRLEEEYNKLDLRYRETLVTTAKVAKVLKESDISYVTIKTLRPYPATPNDVDILYLGEMRNFQRAVDILKTHGYREFERVPGQVLFFDERGGDSFNQDKKGGIYYIDLYREAMVKRFVYLNRQNLISFVINKKISGLGNVNVITPSVDLALILFHAMFPNRKYSLEVFYTTLFHLKSMGEEDFNIFRDFIYYNHLRIAIQNSIAIAEELYRSAFGEIPQQFLRLKECIGNSIFGYNDIVSEKGASPYQIRFPLFLIIFLEKLFDFASLKSLFVQAFCLLSPKYFVRFFHQLFNKSEIDKRYKQV